MSGEWLTIALTSEAVRLLVTETRYEVPEQDLAIPFTGKKSADK